MDLVKMYRYEFLNGKPVPRCSFSVLFLVTILVFSTVFLHFYYYTKHTYIGALQKEERSYEIPKIPEISIIPKVKTERIWDTIDGKGYQFKKENAPKVYDDRYHQLNTLPPCGNLSNSERQEEVLNQIEILKNEFKNCIEPIVEQWRGKAKEMNLDWVQKASICDKIPVFENLQVVPFRNQHEIKYAILPKCKEENILLTLGVGHDTTAEEKVEITIPNTKFYGADPIIEPNRQMYSAFGKFFPFAIGRQPGFTKFRVLPNQNQKTRRYVFQDVTTIPYLYFVKDILKLKKIDHAWFDIEGGEFEFLDQLHDDDVTICQFNIEVHSKFRPVDGAQAFHDFIFEVLEKQKYVFLNSIHGDIGVHRMYFVNVQDKECVGKYFNNY